MPLAEIGKERVPAGLIQASGPDFLDRAAGIHQNGVGNAGEAELRISSIGWIGQYVGKRHTALEAILFGDFDGIAAHPQHADAAFLSERARQAHPLDLIGLASGTPGENVRMSSLEPSAGKPTGTMRPSSVSPESICNCVPAAICGASASCRLRFWRKRLTFSTSTLTAASQRRISIALPNLIFG